MSNYHRIFFEAFGSGPHECHFCGKIVAAAWDGTRFRQRGRKRISIHHKDGDHKNNDPSNLALSHGGCHVAHHWTNKKHSDEAKMRQSIAHQDLVCPPGCQCGRHKNGSKKCEPGCTCGRHKDYSGRRNYRTA